jgi:E3 ubiquitin-protein ligase RNF115/126
MCLESPRKYWIVRYWKYPNTNITLSFLASLFGPSEPGAAFVARLFGSASGDGGDYVYSQAELDRIISQLMEQHQGNAPPPASKEDIEALPKVKVTEQMVKDDMDCVVCKEDLVVDEIATPLPCKHTYHFECISKWLEAHDVCIAAVFVCGFN